MPTSSPKTLPKALSNKLPKIAFIYLDHVLRFFDRSNFKDWPDKIESVVYHWGKDKQRFIDEVQQKKINVLIGNIPATAYETFREIARALPQVQFIPSIDSQFANKSKENVTNLCKKYAVDIPQTDIFYNTNSALAFLSNTEFPKIIKKSYGPSNYGGYFVHKVDSYQEAVNLIELKKYQPVYVQEFVPMQADIRVMLIDHKPVCAFWRRPAAGGWLTNTSQGGSMDYDDVPEAVLALAVKTSKASNAQYWACDVAVGEDGQYRILECATAFAAFPYIRDWIGQYLSWLLSEGQFKQPHIPLYHWQQLGKIDASLLRTMRNITFGNSPIAGSQDSGELFSELDSHGQPSALIQPQDSSEQAAQLIDKRYPIVAIEPNDGEEWPSEIWDRQSRGRHQAEGL
jgi:hypothetical protein